VDTFGKRDIDTKDFVVKASEDTVNVTSDIKINYQLGK